MRLGRLGEEARQLRDYVAEMEQDEEEGKERSSASRISNKLGRARHESGYC